MEILINRKLKELAKEKQVKILFAVESGSRVWRLNSKDSDYDVRFVFTYPLERYISINKSSDMINIHYDREGNKMPQEGCFIDVCGFDIFKFSKMLSSSNPTVIEWLNSDIVYFGKKSKVWVDYANKQYKPISLYFHYKSMCRQNYLKYVKSGNLVSYKKYLYAMRGLVNAKYMTLNFGLPPINFNETLTEIKRWEWGRTIKVIPDCMVHILNQIIKLKREGNEKDITKNIPLIDDYIESFLKDDDEAPDNKQLSTNKVLDEELKKVVLG